MKYTKYLYPLVLGAALCSCAGDGEAKIDPVIKAERQALNEAQSFGVFQNGKSIFKFDKNTQQVLINPSRATFRFQTDEGDKYVELKLNGMPSSSKAFEGTLSSNFGVANATLKKVILLRSQGDTLRLWSDDQHMGFVLPGLPK